ncbi:hypothetical protein FRC02_011909 [Tulasnella sp. 418]|nr:hypothetical protein FRC02_011909 [Tulasnella sp. 418]
MADSSHFNKSSNPPAEQPPTSTVSYRRVYSYHYDKLNSFDLEWTSLQEFDIWRQTEENHHCIEFNLKETRYPEKPVPQKPEPAWLWRHIYVCSREGGGGKSKYVKQHPERERKKDNKRMENGCPCKLSIKAYPGMQSILGQYCTEHSHEIGSENVKFTRIPTEAREFIAQMLRMKVDPNQINIKLKTLYGGVFSDLLKLLELKDKPQHNQFITLADIRHIEVGIEAETVRLAPIEDSGLSVDMGIG